MRNIQQRFRLDKARKYIRSVGTLHLPDTNHICPLCNVTIELDIDEVLKAESELPMSVRQGLIYISGYVLHQLPVLNDLLDEEDSKDEYNKYGQMISELNRGGLKIRKDCLVFFTYYCYIAFVLQQEIQCTCQKNYISFFTEINQYTDLLPRNCKKVCRILSNTFLNNWSKRQNERTAERDDLIKLAKLSN